MALEDLNKFISEQGLSVVPEVVPEATWGDDIAGGARAFLGQGALLGWGDELEGKVESWFTDTPYDEVVTRIRAEMKGFEERNPGTALTAEILGSIAPTAALLLSGAGTAGGAANVARVGAKIPSFLQKMKTTLPIAAGESATFAVGEGEEGIEKDIDRAVGGAAWGLAGGTILGGALHGGQKLYTAISNKIRNSMGDGASRAVMRQLEDLVEETGRPLKEIVSDIHAGRLMADNKTLTHAISSIFTEGGEVKSFLTKEMGKHATETGEAFKGTMQKGMTPDVEDNVFKAWTKGDKEAKQQESALYKGAFQDSPELTPDVVDTLLESLNRLPNAKTDLDEIYKAKGGIVPFYKVEENGAISIVRKPTLEDAEIIRRKLSETTSDAFRSGKGSLGEPLGELEKVLRSQIDELSPTLKKIRKNASNVRKQRDAFKLGKGALSKNADEMAVYMDDLIGTSPTRDNAQVLKAFRMGAMNALRHKMKEPTYSRKVAEEGSKENSMIRLVFPDDKVDELLAKAQHAETAYTMKSKVTASGSGGGSDTQGRMAAQQRRINQGIASGEGGATQQAMMAAVDFVISKIAPKLDDKGRMEVAKILYSRNPELVEDTITGNTPKAVLQQQINDIITGMGYFGTPGAVATQPNEGIMDQMNVAPR